MPGCGLYCYSPDGQLWKLFLYLTNDGPVQLFPWFRKKFRKETRIFLFKCIYSKRILKFRFLMEFFCKQICVTIFKCQPFSDCCYFLFHILILILILRENLDIDHNFLLCNGRSCFDRNRFLSKTLVLF